MAGSSMIAGKGVYEGLRCRSVWVLSPGFALGRSRDPFRARADPGLPPTLYKRLFQKL